MRFCFNSFRSGQDENGETIEVEVLDEDGQLNMLADEATKSLVESDGDLQIEMEEHNDDEDSGGTSPPVGNMLNGAAFEATQQAKGATEKGRCGGCATTLPVQAYY